MTSYFISTLWLRNICKKKLSLSIYHMTSLSITTNFLIFHYLFIRDISHNLSIKFILFLYRLSYYCVENHKVRNKDKPGNSHSLVSTLGLFGLNHDVLSYLVMCRASVFRASGGLEPSIFWTFRASGGLGYQHFGPGRALNLSNELRAGTELLQLRNIIIFFIIWEKPKLNSLKFIKYE